MNRSIDSETWKLGAIAVVLAVVLPTLIELTVTAMPVVTSVT